MKVELKPTRLYCLINRVDCQKHVILVDEDCYGWAFINSGIIHDGILYWQNENWHIDGMPVNIFLLLVPMFVNNDYEIGVYE